VRHPFGDAGTEQFHSSDDFDRKGFELCEAGDFESALKIYQEGLSIFPFTPELHSGEGHMYLYTGEFVHALTAFRRCLDLSSLDPDLNKGAALALLYLNRSGEAFEYIDRARPYFQDDEHTLFELGLALYQVNRHKEAQRFLGKVILLNPTHIDSHLYMALSLHHGGMGESKTKYRSLETAQELDPDRQDIIEHFAHVLYEDGHPAEAQAQFEKLTPEEVTDEVTLERMLQIFGTKGGNRRLRTAVKRRLREIKAVDSTDDLIRDLQLDWESGLPH
jgi:tetratricopeptide (TPR) repeat protein